MVDFQTLYSATLPFAVLAPFAIVAPFVGFTIGIELAKLAERRVIQRRLAQATGRYVSHGRREGWWA